MAVGIEQVIASLATARSKVEAEMHAATVLAAETLGAGARRSMPNHLRGVGTSGAALGVAVSVKGRHKFGAVVKATGPAHLVDHPTKAHTVKVRRATALSTPFGPKASVSVKGTAGKGTFDKGVAEALPAARAIIEAAHERAAQRIL